MEPTTAIQPVATEAQKRGAIEFVNQRGLTLRTYEDMWRFANLVVRAGWAPKGMEKAESIMIAVQFGAELGLNPMTSVQRIAPINGRPTVWGDVMLGLCRTSPAWDESGFKERIVSADNDSFHGVCECRRKGGNTCFQRFSIADAKRAKLWGKQGPWTQYPNRMLQMRARAFALRDTFPDVLCGVYAREEMDGEPYKEVTVVAHPTDAELEAELSADPVDGTLKLELPKERKSGEPVAEVIQDVATEPEPSQELQDNRLKAVGMYQKLSADKKKAVAENLGIEGVADIKTMTKLGDFQAVRDACLSA